MKKIKTKFKMKVIRFLFWLWHGKEKNYSLPPKNVQTILFLRTDGIGDFVISTPLLRELRKTYPTAKISYLITNFIKELVDPCPYKDEVIVLKYKDPKDLLSFKWSHLLYFF
jgi:ADP-heptose:LPS heptosyltransferase